ncbi:MAG: CoA transferase [bacterium]
MAEVVNKLRSADVPVAPVLSPEMVRDTEQVAATELIRKVAHPDMGEFLQPRAGTNIFGVDLKLTPAPAHGEHSKEILKALGHSTGEINRLVQSGIVICR